MCQKNSVLISRAFNASSMRAIYKLGRWGGFSRWGGGGGGGGGGGRWGFRAW